MVSRATRRERGELLPWLAILLPAVWLPIARHPLDLQLSQLFMTLAVWLLAVPPLIGAVNAARRSFCRLRPCLFVCGSACP